MAINGERFSDGTSYSYYSGKLAISRKQGASAATMAIYGRTSKESRQQAADHTKSITETATLTKINDREYLVTYETTHRIVPVETLAAAGIE